MTLWGATTKNQLKKLTKNQTKNQNRQTVSSNRNETEITIEKTNYIDSEIIKKNQDFVAITGAIYSGNKQVSLKKAVNKINDPTELMQLDGEYAFAWLSNKKLMLGRDRIGSIPLYYTQADGVTFSTNQLDILESTEKKPKRVVPGKLYKIDGNKIETKNISNTNDLKNESKTKTTEEYGREIINKLDQAVQRRVGEETAIAFSGGVDSSLIAVLADRYTDVTLYTVGYENSPDIEWSKKASEHLELPHKPIEIDLPTIKKTIPETIKATCDATRLSIGVGLPFLILSKKLRKDGYRTVLTGQGSDELFGGYTKYRNSDNPETEMARDIDNIAEKDLERDYHVFTNQNILSKNPFLDQKVVKTALSIPIRDKIPDENEIEKKILRAGAKKLLPPEITKKPKKSLQYGSRVDREIDRIARRNGYKRREKHHVDKYLAAESKKIFKKTVSKHVTRSFNN
ncbi:asparagine synthetase B [Methanonatronarchaeum sp. AMET-Sl]|uniref:asparagine synthase family protein n=1 Tax=Methanonatronarchaeum sp. AMET-Sl TaxID=3037654 RepID=UPI00244DA46F|nr:asparagine synthetase B [Methanonatronarchaeum sp. AMET-Sl]WGI17493.1 asparagine synthetase B [Methanonatronarchaeum sp. AMET-Sl]